MFSSIRRRWFAASSRLVVAVLTACFLTSCASAPEEKHYPIQAEVISVDLPKKVIVVKHGEIPGLMPRMTMTYLIRVPQEAAGLAPGDKISADLVVSENRGRLEKIVLIEKAKPNPAPAPATESTPHAS